MFLLILALYFANVIGINDNVGKITYSKLAKSGWKWTQHGVVLTGSGRVLCPRVVTSRPMYLIKQPVFIHNKIKRVRTICIQNRLIYHCLSSDVNYYPYIIYITNSFDVNGQFIKKLNIKILCINSKNLQCYTMYILELIFPPSCTFKWVFLFSTDIFRYKFHENVSTNCLDHEMIFQNKTKIATVTYEV